MSRKPQQKARKATMGFCLFNNIAIASEFAITELGAKRVFICR